MQGYIAMLAVDSGYRKRGIGSSLAKIAIARMRDKYKCDEVILEAELTNKGALGLYGKLGFVREKRLRKYYLNGNDAFKLTLWFPKRPAEASSEVSSAESEKGE